MALRGRWALDRRGLASGPPIALAPRSGARTSSHHNTSAAHADATVGELRQLGVEAFSLRAELERAGRNRSARPRRRGADGRHRRARTTPRTTSGCRSTS
jgi:hypothetical protein